MNILFINYSTHAVLQLHYIYIICTIMCVCYIMYNNYICMYVAVPRQDSMSPACKGECCPVWVLQQICWMSLGKQHGRIVYSSSLVPSFIHVGCLGIHVLVFHVYIHLV